MSLIADVFRGPAPWVLSTWEVIAGLGVCAFVFLIIGLLLGVSDESAVRPAPKPATRLPKDVIIYGKATTTQPKSQVRSDG